MLQETHIYFGSTFEYSGFYCNCVIDAAAAAIKVLPMNCVRSSCFANNFSEKCIHSDLAQILCCFFVFSIFLCSGRTGGGLEDLMKSFDLNEGPQCLSLFLLTVMKYPGSCAPARAFYCLVH